MNTNLKPRTLTQLAVAATAMTLLSASIAAACHPVGTITKSVENTTTHVAASAADTTTQAVVAHPGDTLVYHITVADTATGNDDQMINTKVTDALPAGLQLVKADSFNLGTVAIKKSVAVTVTAKVTATTAGYIKNQACFTADSVDHKLPQAGCDVAYIKVVVPTPSPTPSATPTPSTTPKPSTTPVPSTTPTPTSTPGGQGEVLSTTAPTTLPDTGAPLGATALGLGSMVAAGTAYFKSRKTQR